MSAQTGERLKDFCRQNFRMPDDILGFHVKLQRLPQDRYVADGYVVHEGPECGGFGGEPPVIANHSRDLLLGKFFLQPANSFRISQFQNTFNCVFRMSVSIKRLDIDIPKEGMQVFGNHLIDRTTRDGTVELIVKTILIRTVGAVYDGL